MKRISLIVLTIVLASLAPLRAQRYIRQGEKVYYELRVFGEPKFHGFSNFEKPEVTKKWWTAFMEKANKSGYCFDLLTLPLLDRPQLGDKAVILDVGGPGQLVQVIEIPPGGKTRWHSYGFDGEPLFYVLKGKGQTEYYSPLKNLPPLKYIWKRNSMFAIAREHIMQHTNTDSTEPLRLLAVIGYAITLNPYVADELRGGRQNPAENQEERAAVSAVATYPGHFVDDLREHPVTVREARGLKNAYFNTMATVGHQTQPNIHVSEMIGDQAYAHKHDGQPMFVILKGKGYDIWSEAPNLKAYEADLAAGRVHRASYQEGTLCGVPPGPHWHQHFRTGSEPLRWLAIVCRREYEEESENE